MISRIKECAAEMGITSLREMRPIYRCVMDLIPERKEMIRIRSAYRREKERREKAEAIVDSMRGELERLCCDQDVSKLEMYRRIESTISFAEHNADVLVT